MERRQMLPRLSRKAKRASSYSLSGSLRGTTGYFNPPRMKRAYTSITFSRDVPAGSIFMYRICR